MPLFLQIIHLQSLYFYNVTLISISQVKYRSHGLSEGRRYEWMSTTFVKHYYLQNPSSIILIWICSFGPCPDFYANCNVPNSAHGKNVYNYCTLGVAIIMLLCCPIFINCKLYYRPNMPESRRDAFTSALADYRIGHFCHITFLWYIFQT